MEEAGVPPHVIDLGVLHQKRKGISRTYMHHNYTAEKKDVVEVHRGMRAEEPRRTNVGAPPTINVKVTRQWMFEV